MGVLEDTIDQFVMDWVADAEDPERILDEIQAAVDRRRPARGLREQFVKEVRRAKRRAFMDSNDGEIQALQDAVSTACSLLDVDDETIATEAEQWAIERGYA